MPKVLTEQVIRDAMDRTMSNSAAAKYLRMNIITYRKYASLYIDEDSGKTLYEIHSNRRGRGVPKRKITLDGEILRDALVKGVNLSHSNIQKIKDSILRFGLLPHECSKCHFHERRMLDQKIPLLLWFKDGNKYNAVLKNITLLCYNCYFLHVSDIFNKRQEKLIEDIHSSQIIRNEYDWDIDYENDLKPLKEDLSGKEFISKY